MARNDSVERQGRERIKCPRYCPVVGTQRMRQGRDYLGSFTDRWGRNRGLRRTALTEWHAYLEAYRAEAETATHGVYVNRKGESRGIRGSQYLEPRCRLTEQWKSAELKAWQDKTGPPISFRSFMRELQEI